jgi:pimeloyl-ACP methyl ester carboxylesterase
MDKMAVAAGLVVGVPAILAAAARVTLWRPDIPYARLESKYAQSTSRFAELPGDVRLHYRDDGDPSKPVVMLVHGYGDSFLSWEPWIDRLSPDFRVITLDLPGHGLTRAPAGYAASPGGYAALIDAFAAQLDLPPFAIVGNSMGGGVAWNVAVHYPRRVSSLVLVAAAGWPDMTLKRPSLAFRLVQSPLGVFLLKHFETRPLTRAALRANFVRKTLVTRAFVNRWVEVQRAPGHRDILLGMRPGQHGAASAAMLATIDAPTLILHGEQDTVIEVESSRKFAEAIPGARLITYPDGGHLPQVDIPARSAADVTAFLKSCTTQAQARDSV